MATILPQGKQYFESSAGQPLVGGRLYTFLAGTSTPKATYADQSGTVPNTNPVVLDARGEALVYWSGAYKAELRDAANSLIWTVDNIFLDAGEFIFDGAPVSEFFKSRNGVVVNSIAALRAISKTKFTQSFVSGYYAAGDGGGGHYWYDSSDTTSADNGGTIIVAADGGRWKLIVTGALSVKQFGATGNSVTDDTAAIVNTLKTGRNIFFPTGVYLCAPTTFTGVADVKISGVPGFGAQVKFTQAGVGWKFSGCTNFVIEDMTFFQSGTTPGCRGMQIDTSSNCMLIRCLFYSFTDSALAFIGTLPAQLSGNHLHKCLFLSNAGANGQVFTQYANDFIFSDNQFGIFSGGAAPAYGLRMDHSSNGTLQSNFIWENTIGLYMTASQYNRFTSNRFEQSLQEGCILEQVSTITFVGNWLNNNGRQALNTYDSLRLITATVSQFTDNQVFDWSGGVNSHRYSISVNTNCNNLVIRNNLLNGYGTCPIFFDATHVLAQITCDATVCGNSVASLAAGSTNYTGPSGSNATEARATVSVPFTAVVARISAQVYAAPGVGQSFTYTLFKNAVATAMSFTITDNNVISGSTTGPITILQGDTLSIRVTTSAGANVNVHLTKIDIIGR